MRTRLKAVAVGLMLSAAVCAAPAVAGGRASSQVEITDFFGENDVAVFEGLVTSPASKCAGKGRKVKVVGYDQGGPKRTLGTDETNGQGKFAVGEPIPFSEDFAYAKVKATKDCKGDRSEPISTSG